jgi:soluble lytic murein transglycosylase
MRQNWERIIRVNCLRSGLRLARKISAVFALVLLISSGFDLLAVSRVKKHKAVRKPKKKKAPAKPPAPPKPRALGPAAALALAKQYLDAGNFTAALEQTNIAAVKVPQLNDYAQFYRAQAEYQLKNYPEVAQSVAQVFNQQLISPLTGPAAAIGVAADLDSNSPKVAFDLVKKYFDKIPQPQASLLLARCLLANNDLPQAAEYFQRVYYNYPNSKEAADAATALVDVQHRLADGYPPVMPAAMLGRAEKLLDAHRAADAKTELFAAIPQLTGVQRDQARVRLGEADFRAGKISDAFEYLKTLKVDDSEADAERQAFLVRCARRLDKKSDVKAYLDELAQSHPASEWRLDALINVADQARAENDTATYVPLYRACAMGFAKNKRAGWCAWRAAFDAYRTEQPDAADLLLAYIQQFPESTDTSDALYFLGRLAEKKSDWAGARAAYDLLLDHLPNTYYATLAQMRLKSADLKAVLPDPAKAATLRAIAWPSRPQFPSFEPGPLVEKRVVRAQLLLASEMHDLAEEELKFGSRNEEGQTNVYAYQLAKFASGHGAPDEALRYIKTFAPGYLYMPLDQAPLDFWRLAFPFPFRGAIEEYSRQQGLDPFLVAALIRQESEFNIRSISPAKAYGLMQVLPSTGRQLARHFGIRRFNAAELLTADRNIQLGTYFFRTLLDASGGEPEIALASYNAGPGRSSVWRTWGPFHEPAEFTEVVPFHETRGYIQIVLRNADMYRRLYAGTHADIPPYHPKPAPQKATAKKGVKTRAKIHRRKSHKPRRR